MDSVGLTLVDKEGGIPDGRVLGKRDHIHPEGAVRLISQRSILEGDGGAGEVVEGSRCTTGFTKGLFRRRIVRCGSAQETRC